MNNLNIPLYRGFSKTFNKYILGIPYFSDGRYYMLVDDCNKNNDIGTGSFPIDETTLSINFYDMQDGLGNKIFASLSEDGKGGDILYYEDDCQPYICEHSSDGTFLFEYLDNKTIKNYICRLSQEKVLFEDLKVIGIQE